MKRIIILGTLYFAMLILSKSGIDYTGNEEVFLLGGFESKNCFISYVEINGNHYILKQKKRSISQIAVVREALAAHVAQVLAIAHLVKLISPNKYIPGKVNMMWPATLHTIAPGNMVRALVDSKYSLLCLKQRCEDDPSPNEKGLTEEIIRQMTWHKQLSVIVALDLFVANADRHGGNLFYDTETDSFCAIDMDNTFKCNLCALACKNLDAMVSNQKKFNKNEIRALIRMKDTLVFLLHRYKPEKLIKKMRYFATRAGFVPNNTLYTEREEKKLLHYESIIMENYASAQRLVSVLEQIIHDLSQ